MHISAEELLNYQIPENSFVKLVVVGETDKVREMVKLDKVKELLASQRVKLSIQERKKKKSENLNIDMEILSTQCVPFQSRLSQVLNSEKPEIQACFQKIFGTLKMEI